MIYNYKTYNIFISHSWAYSYQYDKVEGFLHQEGLAFKNYSVPKDSPVHTNGKDKQLYEAIKKQIAYANCVLILAGVYSSYSKWIDKEIQIAKELGKPIIAIEYWGSEHTSIKVKAAADKIVGWNARSIVKAIKEYAL